MPGVNHSVKRQTNTKIEWGFSFPGQALRLTLPWCYTWRGANWGQLREAEGEGEAEAELEKAARYTNVPARLSTSPLLVSRLKLIGVTAKLARPHRTETLSPALKFQV
jgi:hypothetical protein